MVDLLRKGSASWPQESDSGHSTAQVINICPHRRAKYYMSQSHGFCIYIYIYIYIIFMYYRRKFRSQTSDKMDR